MKKSLLLAIAAVISLASMAQEKKDLFAPYYKYSSWRPISIDYNSIPKIGDGIVHDDKNTFIYVDSFKISLDSLRHLLTKKPDTAYVPVYLVDVTDTVAATFIYGEKILKRGIGYALIRGFKMQTARGPQWATQPNISGVLDEKKRPVSNAVISTVVPVQQKPASQSKQ